MNGPPVHTSFIILKHMQTRAQDSTPCAGPRRAASFFLTMMAIPERAKRNATSAMTMQQLFPGLDEGFWQAEVDKAWGKTMMIRPWFKADGSQAIVGAPENTRMLLGPQRLYAHNIKKKGMNLDLRGLRFFFFCAPDNTRMVLESTSFSEFPPTPN